MIFAQKVLAPGPGTRPKATLGVAAISIRFERFPGFHTPGSAGGHDSPTVIKRQDRSLGL